MGIATLARLMSAHLPLIIEPEKYAQTGKHLTGSFTVSDLSALADLVQNRDGCVNYELLFSRDSKGWINATGTISAHLILQCQRCLEAMTLEVQNKLRLAIVNNQKEAEFLPDNLEPYLTEDKKISLNKLIEEELLLALPLSPLHEQEECPAINQVRAHGAKRESPFSILKNLKNSNT